MLQSDMAQDIDTACRNDLLAIAKTYGRATDRSLATVSRMFHGNQAFLGQFEKGECSITLSKLRVMVDAFSEEWPSGIYWPNVEVLFLPKLRGVVYAIQWANRPEQIKVGFAKNFQRRLAVLKNDARDAGTDVVVIGTVKGRIQNERSVHRYLEDHVSWPRRRSWYKATPTVMSIIQKLFAPDFAWVRSEELIKADEGWTEGGSRRKKSGLNGVEKNPPI